jgi:glyoxylase-like metal-dependent hydrolase (beta-lactamase superfamily II)
MQTHSRWSAWCCHLLCDGDYIVSLSTLALTHPHCDHVGGCRPISDAMPVGTLFDAAEARRSFSALLPMV